MHDAARFIGHESTVARARARRQQVTSVVCGVLSTTLVATSAVAGQARPSSPAWAGARRHRRRLPLPRPAARPPARRGPRCSSVSAASGHGRSRPPALGAAHGARKAPLLVVSLALLPRTTRASSPSARPAPSTATPAGSAPTSGRRRPGHGRPLGWEANLGSRVHPWGVDDASQVPAYSAAGATPPPRSRPGGPAIQRRVDQLEEVPATRRARPRPCTRATTRSTAGACSTTTRPAEEHAGVWDKYYARRTTAACRARHLAHGGQGA